jgi:NAD(P)-dependent dehydrogenase (short-subunit alcohol dehydrogenase family)
MSLLDKSTAVVTGGSSGLGRSICEQFAAEGANVVVADVREEPREGGTPTHELLESEYDVSAAYVECDVTEKSDHEAAVEAASELGTLDIWVNNAGVFRAEEFTEVTEDEYDWLMDINVKGTFFGAQIAIEQMLDTGTEGNIINLSSVAGLSGSDNFVTYCTSKGAVRLMTYSLADKYGPEGINTNAIHPGIIETKMVSEDVPIIGSESEEAFLQQVPARRFGQPEDISDAAVYLASDMSDYVNGESLVVDGGMTNT